MQIKPEKMGNVLKAIEPHHKTVCTQLVRSQGITSESCRGGEG
jgi:hypothetical protein